MENVIPIIRSFLSVPGDKQALFDKAHKSAANAIIVDLEDAVAARYKTTAREIVARSLPHVRPIPIRINGQNTDWIDGDLSLCMRPSLIGIILPKKGCEDDIRYV